MNRDLIESVKHLPEGSPEAKAWKAAQKLAADVMSGRSEDPTNGALFYHTTEVSPGWAEGQKIIARVNNHVFYARAKQA